MIWSLRPRAALATVAARFRKTTPVALVAVRKDPTPADPSTWDTFAVTYHLPGMYDNITDTFDAPSPQAARDEVGFRYHDAVITSVSVERRAS